VLLRRENTKKILKKEERKGKRKRGEKQCSRPVAWHVEKTRM
jgi:hypothetical protein